MAAPAQPAAPALDRAEPRSLRVHWTALAPPPDPPQQSWSLRWRTAAHDGDPPGPWQTRTGVNAATLTATIPDLDPDTPHDVAVRAVNSDGDGPWSAALVASTQEDPIMPLLQADLTAVQIGIESASNPGDLVAATRRILYTDGSYEPIVQRQTLEERGAVLADTTDVVTMRGSTLDLTEELSPETVVAPLLCALAAVDPTTDDSARLWTFQPAVNAPTGLRTATIEVAETDGAAGNYRGRFGHARPTSISIEASTDTATLSTTWMGRRRQALTTPSSAAPPDRWIIPAAAFEVSIDPNWAALGTTKVGVVRSLALTIDPGLTEAQALAGRSDLDAAYWRRGRIRGNLELTVDHDDDTTDELSHFETGALRYVRLHAHNGGDAAAARALTIDAVVRWIDTPDVLAADGPTHTLDLAGQLRADAAGNILRIAARNALPNW